MDHTRDDEILRALGNNLKKIRTAKNLSTRELGLIADLDFGHINEIENGKKNPGVLVIYALAEALRIDPRDLLPSPGKG